MRAVPRGSRRGTIIQPGNRSGKHPKADAIRKDLLYPATNKAASWLNKKLYPALLQLNSGMFMENAQCTPRCL